MDRFEFRARSALPALTVSADHLRSFVLLHSLRSGAAFLRSSTNNGHKKVLPQVSGAGFSPCSFMTIDHLVWSPLPALRALSGGRGCQLLPCLRVAMAVLAFVLHIFIMCFILRLLTHVPCLA